MSGVELDLRTDGPDGCAGALRLLAATGPSARLSDRQVLRIAREIETARRERDIAKAVTVDQVMAQMRPLWWRVSLAGFAAGAAAGARAVAVLA